jgi:hypothetical protein
MAGEKPVKTAKLASRGRAPASRSVGKCTCGGDLIWAKVFTPRGRMMKYCEKCGGMTPKAA